MRNGTIRRMPWVWTLLLALLVALFSVGCGDTSAQSDADVTATETQGQETSVETNGAGAQTEAEAENTEDLTRSRPKNSNTADLNLPESGTYTSKDEVAWYLHTYGHLPSNFVTKKTAEKAGWKTRGLTIDEACPGKSIGGDRFGNYEGKLPDKRGRKWYECDIDYHGGKSRGAKRIVYSSDGLIYYTGDHYSSFDRIY